jgi:Zn-dependent protease with chaperone function/uncharacterized tellurite resistance protein B-like protein
MTATAIRCTNDLKLYQSLLENADVKRVRGRIQRLEEKRDQPGVRRHLLATSVRLSRSMSAPLHHMADQCTERLGIDSPLELYAYANPKFNAACFKPEEGRVFIMLSSSLLEAFSDTELLFVMGHELGHHVYQHHELPIGYILRGPDLIPPALALDLFTWSRYAEASADRAGAYCAKDLQSVTHALFKLASGISDDRIVQFDLNEFLRQVDDMLAFDDEPGQGAPQQDWFLTHPFSPLRVKALKHFHESDLMCSGGMSKARLEDCVRQVMGVMEPDYMKGKTDAARAMRNLFLAGAITVAEAHEGISDQEREAIKKFFEKGYALEKLDSSRLREILPERIVEAKELTSLTQRMQVVRDLCIVAQAERPITAVETNLLNQIASGLELPTNFVTQCLEGSTELD